jgi:hypothetical protein
MADAVRSRQCPTVLPFGNVTAAERVGLTERLSRHPARLHVTAVIAAAQRLSEALRRIGGK